jgi:hypothetical protein
MTSLKSTIEFLDSKRHDDEELFVTKVGTTWSHGVWSETVSYSDDDDFVWIAFDEDTAKWIVTKRYFDSRVQFGYIVKTEAIDAVIEYLRDFEE